MVGKRIPANRLRSLGCFVAAAMVLAACGGSQYRYVSNSTENLYLKVPKEWKQYKLTDTDKDGRATSIPEGALRVWHYAYDASAESTDLNLKTDSPEFPVTDVQVWSLSDSTNDRMSLSQVRSIAFNGFDPLLQDPGTPPKWEVVDFSGKSEVRLTFPKGVTGTRMAVNVPNKDDPTKFHTVDAATLVDPTNKRFYILRTQCSAQCYLNNRKVIDTVAESWTVNRS
jgi:hypothetical protein